MLVMPHILATLPHTVFSNTNVEHLCHVATNVFLFHFLIQLYVSELDYHIFLLENFEVNQTTFAMSAWHMSMTSKWGQLEKNLIVLLFRFMTISVMSHILGSWQLYPTMCWVMWMTNDLLPKKLGFLWANVNTVHLLKVGGATHHVILGDFSLSMVQATCALIFFLLANPFSRTVHIATITFS